MADLVSLSVAHVPNKTRYVSGDFFEKYGMTVRAHYSDGSSSLIEGYSCSPSSALSESTTRITVSFGGKTTYQQITVSEPPSSGYFPCHSIDSSELGGNPCVNAADGSFRFRCSPFSVERDSYKLSVSLAYNSRMSSRESDLIKGMMRGFRTNFHQFLILDGVDSNGVGLYKYIDGDGYVHTFSYDQPLEAYIDTGGKGLRLETQTRTITDEADGFVSFDASGRLVSIGSGQNPSDVKAVEYNSDGLRKVYDQRNPSTYIKFSYEYSHLRWVKIYCDGELLRTYTLNGFMGQISSIDESAGGESRTLYQFSVNDRDRVNRFVDCLTKDAYRLTYEFDGGLNDYRFNSLRKGYMDNGSFIQFEGVYLSERKINALVDYGIIQEFVVRDDNGIETSYMMDTEGALVSTFERGPDDHGSYRSLIRDEGIWVPKQGDHSESISDSRSFDVAWSDEIMYGLQSGDLGGETRVKLVGYIKVPNIHERVRLSFEAWRTESRDVDINPRASGVWQYFEIPFDREVGPDGTPLPFSSFRLSAYDEEPRQIEAEAANLQWVSGGRDERLYIDAHGGPVPFHDIAALKLYSSNYDYDLIEDSSSPFFMNPSDLVRTVRRCNSHMRQGVEVYLDGGRRITAAASFLVAVTKDGQDIMLLNPSVESGRSLSLFFEDPRDHGIRTYYRFSSHGYALVKRYPRETYQYQETSLEYDYQGRLVRSRNADESSIMYSYFDDGAIESAVETEAPGCTPRHNVFYEAELDSSGKRIVWTRSDRVEMRSEYSGYHLSKKSLLGNGGQELSSIGLTYNAFGDEVWGNAFRVGQAVAESHSYSRPSMSYKTNYVSDGPFLMRITKAIASRKTAFGVLSGGVYDDVYDRIETPSATTERYKGMDGSFASLTVSRDAYGNAVSMEFGGTSASFRYRENHASRYADQIESVYDGFSGRTFEFSYNDFNEVSSFSDGWFESSFYVEGAESVINESFGGGERYELRVSAASCSAAYVDGYGSSPIAVASWEYALDELGRVSRKASAGSGVTIEIGYADMHSQKPSGFSFRMGASLYSEGYWYDRTTGKLAGVTRSFGGLTRESEYTYDSLGRLVSCSSNGDEKTYSYVDGTVVGGALGRMSAFGGVNMGYDEKGRLTSFGGVSISYDPYGNTISKGEVSFSWERGTLLASAGSTSFTYDYRGLRAVKLSSGVRHRYSYVGSALAGEDVYSSSGILMRRLRYFYDRNGLCSLRVYEGRNQAKDYVYIRNPFGDIVGLCDEDGLCALYGYDAWGNCTVCNPNGTENASPSFIGNVNPFRYRSYYYDVETGLYWLSSRYYDPEIGRFISPDSVDYLDPTSINGLNLYAYCNNDPINYIDPSGHSALLIGLLIFTGVMTIAGATFGGVSAGMNGGNTGDILAGIGKGALNGLIVGGGISLAIGGFAIGGLTNLGSIMATYGLSITANMFEVAITQGKKSYFDGDSFWAGASDINNAMFANSGNILIGKPTIMSIPFYGTRVVSKMPTVLNVYASYSLDNLFDSMPFLTSAKATLMSRASWVGLGFGYGLTAYQYFLLIYSIITTPDFENSRWILY